MTGSPLDRANRAAEEALGMNVQRSEPVTDPRDPIREYLNELMIEYGRTPSCPEYEIAEYIAYMLDSLRVVQPGEVVLSAEEAKRLRMLLEGTTGWRQMREEFIALLASGPDREAGA